MGVAATWTKRDNTASASPFVVDLTIAEAGERVVQYRATDKSGNVGAIKTLAFTVENRDVTTVYRLRRGRLDPVEAGRTSGRPRARRSRGASTPRNRAARRPRRTTSSSCGRVATARPTACRVGPLVIPAGGPPVTYQFDQQGVWTFYCSIHAPDMDGTVGRSGRRARTPPRRPPRPRSTGDGTVAATVTLSASDNSSGVAYIDYAVNSTLPADGSEGAGVTRLANTDGTDPFEREFQFTAPGTYTVEYRAVDRAGNREAAKTQTVTVAPPSAPDPGPGPNVTPLPGPVPAPADPGLAQAERDRFGGQEHRDGRAARIPGDARRAGAQHGHRGVGAIRVCADLATKTARQRLSLSGAKCRTVTVAAGKSQTVNVAVRIKRAARGKTTPVRVRVSGTGIADQDAHAEGARQALS